MTPEERTFKKLCQKPISELDCEYRRRFWEFYREPTIFKEWLDEHGWEEDEFYNAGAHYEKENARSLIKHKMYMSGLTNSR